MKSLIFFNNPLAVDGKRVFLDNTRLHLIANLHYFVLFLFQIHLLILLPNSCIVVSRVGFVFSLGTPHRDTHGWRLYLRQEVLSKTVFLDSNYFPAFLLHYKMKSRRS